MTVMIIYEYHIGNDCQTIHRQKCVSFHGDNDVELNNGEAFIYSQY